MWKIHIDFRKKEVSVKIELGARGVNTYRYAGAYRKPQRWQHKVLYRNRGRTDAIPLTSDALSPIFSSHIT